MYVRELEKHHLELRRRYEELLIVVSKLRGEADDEVLCSKHSSEASSSMASDGGDLP
jgi:hypothetical protein